MASILYSYFDAYAFAIATDCAKPTITIPNAPGTMSTSVEPLTPAHGTKWKPVGTGPTIATPWAVRSNAFAAMIERAATINAAGARGTNRPRSEQHREAGHADGHSEPAPRADVADDGEQLVERVPTGLRNTDELGELADRDEEAQSHDEAVEHRFGEEAGDPTHAEEPQRQVEHADDERERRRESDWVGAR